MVNNTLWTLKKRTPKACLQCGEIKMMYSYGKFCSDICKTKWHKNNKREETKEIKP